MTTLIQRSFTGGEIAPALYARVDTVKYQTGARTLRNFFVQRYGGVANRPGTQFVGQSKLSGKRVRLVKFVFNAEQTYVLEFGDEYMRVIQGGAYVTDLTLTITSITNATPCVCTYVGTDPADGDEFAFAGGSGDLSAYTNNRNFRVANVNTVANTFELESLDGTVFSSGTFGTGVSGGTAERIYEIPTDYVEADLDLLKYVQSADVITIVHPEYPPAELSRVDNDDWSIDDIAFDPEISAPGSVTCSGTNGTVNKWVVTAVDEESFEESLPSSEVGSDTAATSGSPRTIGWAAVTGAREYNVYKAQNGVFGFVGIAVGTSFVDTGFTPDTSDTPPIQNDLFEATDEYPSTVAYIQQRLALANTNEKPENNWLSRTGRFKNFTRSSPLQDDDSISFTLAGRQVNQIKHLVDVGQLVIFTSGGEWTLNGDVNGTITPTQTNPKQHSYNGANDLSPIVISGNALYVQARGSIVRDLGFDYQIDGYRGNDLTVFSAHLFDGYTVVDWDYQQIPHSIVWCARSDGKLIGLTYVREHQVLAWHRHDFEGGVVENVCVVPEGQEDVLYLVIKRTIDGDEVRYIERMVSRRVDNVKDSIFMDSTLSYSGINTGMTTMTLSGGTTWAYDETITLTASTSYFTAADVGKEIHFMGADGIPVRFAITAYTNATHVSGRPHRTVSVATGLRSTATTTWTKAIKTVSGLWHLEGKMISVLGDGFVVANPNNAAYVQLTVELGAVTLPKCYGTIHIGLPYTSDLQTLDVDTAEGETISNRKKRANKATIQVEESRGLWIGGREPTDDTVGSDDPTLTELKERGDESMDDPIELKTEPVEVIFNAEWNSNGRIFIRQSDPLPLAISAIAPEGDYPFVRG